MMCTKIVIRQTNFTLKRPKDRSILFPYQISSHLDFVSIHSSIVRRNILSAAITSNVSPSHLNSILTQPVFGMVPASISTREINSMIKTNKINKNPFQTAFKSFSKEKSTLSISLSSSQTIIEKAQKILEQLQRRAHNDSEESKSPLTLQYINDCIVDLSKTLSHVDSKNEPPSFSSKVDIALLAQNILEEMEKLANGAETSRSHLQWYQPDIVTYNAVLNLWAKSDGGKVSAFHAEKILDRLLANIGLFRKGSKEKRLWHGEHGERDLKITTLSPLPNNITFHSVMEAWAKSKTKHSGLKAQEIFNSMLQLNTDWEDRRKNGYILNAMDVNFEVMPNVRSYSIVVDAWANSGAIDAAERAHCIMEKLIKESRNHPNGVVKPNSILFNSVIKAWAKSGKGGYAARKAEEILIKMEQSMILSDNKVMAREKKINTDTPSSFPDYHGFPPPTTRSYSLVLDAWAKSGERDSALKAEAILAKMHKLYDEGYNVKPNRFSYTIVINVLARSRVKGHALRAEKVLDRMIKIYNISDDDLNPSTATFNAVIDAWARSGDKEAGERAESILNRIIELSQQDSNLAPDLTTFNSTITAWARCSKYNESAVSRAEALFSRMVILGDKVKEISPNTVTYNALLYAYSHSKSNAFVTKAEAILDKMEEFQANGNHHIKPNLITYTSMIDVFGRSDLKGMAKKAEEIFNRMIDRKNDDTIGRIKPDIRAYSSLLQACANTRGDISEKRAALIIALKAYDQLNKECRKDESLRPNNIIYRILLEICGFLTSDKFEREQLLEEVFLRCCQDGQLDENSLRVFQRAATPHLFNSIVGKHVLTKELNDRKCEIHNLPAEWSSNVRSVKSQLKNRKRSEFFT